MDPDHLATVEAMGSHLEGSERVPNTLEDLIRRCELVVISSNSNHVKTICRKPSPRARPCSGSMWCWPV